MKPVRPISRPFLRFGTLTAGSRRAPRSVILLAFAVTLFGSATGAAAAAPFCASEAAATPAAIPAAAIPAAELGGTLPGSGAPVAPTAAPPLIQPLPPGKALHFLAGMAGGLLAAAAVESLQNPQLIGSYPLYLPAVALSTAPASEAPSSRTSSSRWREGSRRPRPWPTLSASFLRRLRGKRTAPPSLRRPAPSSRSPS